MLIIALFLSAPAFAQDMAQEAHRRMKLSFSLDAMREMLDETEAPPAPALAFSPFSGLPTLPLAPNSRAESVAVFRDRAVVTRHLEARTAQGADAMTFAGLPFGLAPDSLNANVVSGDARIVGVELISGESVAQAQVRKHGIRDEMRPLATELGEIQDHIEALLIQRTYLRNTLLTSPSGDRALPTLDLVRGTFAYVGEAERDIAARLRKQEERAGELDEDLGPMLVALANPFATGLQVRIDLESAKPGPVTVSLKYQVRGAGWTPAYSARLDEGSGHVRLEYEGVVAQSTGEDWSDVALELSTANPAGSGTAPTLSPWYLGRGGGHHGGLDLDGGYATTVESRGPASGGGLISSDMAASVSGAGAVVFGIQERRTVVGDGSPQHIPLGKQTFEADLELTAIPRNVPELFRSAHIVHQGEAPLMPGPIATYVGGNYVGAGQLPTIVPGESIDLAFGTDRSVRIERQLVSRHRESAGRRSTRWTFHYRIVAHNLAKDAREISVVDQVPVTESDKVDVRVLLATEGAALDEVSAPGIYRWDLKLKPDQTQVVELKFSVTAPTDMPSQMRDQLEMMMR
jgi:hypothetical protein